jgi:hypothetical protein
MKSRPCGGFWPETQINQDFPCSQLAWAFLEAAHFAVRYDATIKRWYQKKCAGSLSVVAIKAVANKLDRACYHIMKEGKPFDVARAFG